LGGAISEFTFCGGEGKSVEGVEGTSNRLDQPFIVRTGKLKKGTFGGKLMKEQVKRENGKPVICAVRCEDANERRGDSHGDSV